MDPEAIRNLLLNLKLQLLALPSLAKWSLLAFAGIIVLREAITLGWNLRARRSLSQPEGEPRLALTPAEPGDKAGPRESGRAALPAPDPLAAPRFPEAELDAVRVRTPPAGMAGH